MNRVAALDAHLSVRRPRSYCPFHSTAAPLAFAHPSVTSGADTQPGAPVPARSVSGFLAPVLNVPLWFSPPRLPSELWSVRCGRASELLYASSSSRALLRASSASSRQLSRCRSALVLVVLS
ncbi:hypothetical protein NL676_011322 [Syzygium grande]|nr:hypothetical protein NL676_011322 [Syzygium grande]